MMPRRFPPPWSVEEYNDACFIVRDHNGQALAYVYFEEEPGRRSAAHYVALNHPLTRENIVFGDMVLTRGICKQCAATVRPGALRCHFCGAALPTADAQTLFLIAVGLPILVVALLLALLFW